MKRYIRIFVMILAFMVTMGNVCVSAQTTEQLTDNLNDLFAKLDHEKKEVSVELRALLKIPENNEDNDIDGVYDQFKTANYNLEDAYKAYNIGSLLVTSYKEKGSIHAIAEETYQWRIPYSNTIGTPGFAIIGEENGELVYLGKSVGETCKNEIITEAMIRAAINDTDIIKEPLTSITYYHSFLYNTFFVVLSDDDTEYVIPFAVMPEWSPVKNGELYTAEELIEKYNKMYDEEELLKHPGSNGGLPRRGEGSAFVLGKNPTRDLLDSANNPNNQNNENDEATDKSSVEKTNLSKRMNNDYLDKEGDNSVVIIAGFGLGSFIVIIAICILSRRKMLRKNK